MSYINSANISLFPLAKDRTNDRSSNMLYEFNLANFINQISDVEGFLIDIDNERFLINTESGTSLELKAGEKFSFNIGGRFVEIDAPLDNPDNNESENTVIWLSGTGLTQGESKNIYAHLYVNNVTQEVHGQDTTSENKSVYEGLEFNHSPNSSRTDCTTYTLHIFNITDGVLTINEDSYRKFSTKTLSPNFRFIDGKVD